ncbi:hypothetical protein [Bacillus mycoides]|uniref:hypothetical protein n=2 Tax=Bacillus mycoides TaxID=1405 RepID=UPI0003E25281|nr:hypothetical protein [Bacillus mycoides]ETT74537.1 hypothetical protein C174_18641 [Bacillus mycoides FSL H7-687]
MQDVRLFLFYLFLIVLGGVISYFLINKVILPSLEKIGEISAKRLMRKSKRIIKHVLLVFEVLVIIVTMALIYFAFQVIIGADIEKMKWSMLSVVCVYPIFIVIISRIKLDVEKELGTFNSIIKKIVAKINKENYLINRLDILFGKTTLSLMIHITIIYVLFVGAINFEHMPYQIYYIVIIILPVSLITFIYFTDRDLVSQNMRRILSYFLLMMIALGKGYNDFKILMGIDTPNQFNDYLVFLFLTVFIAMDRLIKSIVDDYIAYHKPEGNTDFIAMDRLIKSIVDDYIAHIDFTNLNEIKISHVESYSKDHSEASPLLYENGKFRMDVGPSEFKNEKDYQKYVK